MADHGSLRQFASRYNLACFLLLAVVLVLAAPVVLCGCGDWTFSDEVPLNPADPNDSGSVCVEEDGACLEEDACCSGLECTDVDEITGIGLCTPV